MIRDRLVGKIKGSLSRVKCYLETRPLPDLETSQYWSQQEQAAYQSERLVAIYHHHFTHTTGYRELCVEHGLDAHSVRSIEDIGKLPIVERRWLRNRLGVRNDDYRAGGVMHTGGSTGELLEYVGCRRYHRLREHAHQRGWSYFGLNGPEEFTVIASAQANLATARNLSGELDLESLRKVIRALDRPGCAYVRGYSSSCYIVATYMLQHGIRNRFVRCFNLVSENVYDWQRAAIAAAFPEAEVYEEIRLQ